MVADLIAQGDSYIMSFALSLLGSVVNLSLQIFDIIVAIILIVYFMLDGRKLIQSFIDFMPEGAQPTIQRLFEEANYIAKRYIKARIIVCCFMASAVFIGLNMLEVKYAGIFALISFFLDFIPYFGSLIACVIEIFFALITGGVGLAVKVLIFVLIVQQIEGNVVAPKLQGKSVDLHPIWVMFALLACSEIWGPIGMLISTPVAAVVKTALRELYYYMIGDQKSAVAALAEEAAPKPKEEQPKSAQ